MIQPSFREFERLAQTWEPDSRVRHGFPREPADAGERLPAGVAQGGAVFVSAGKAWEGGEKIARYIDSPARIAEEIFRYANGACVLESRQRDYWEERDSHQLFWREHMGRSSGRCGCRGAAAG